MMMTNPQAELMADALGRVLIHAGMLRADVGAMTGPELLLAAETYCEGLRRVDDHLVIREVAGNVPVQGEGTIDGIPFYFRARGQHWSFSVGGPDPVMDADWYYREKYSDEPFMAGWMSVDEAIAFIEKAAKVYWFQKGLG